jgi:uncharacterized membrane protein
VSISTFILIVLYVVYFGVVISLGYISYKMPKFKITKSDTDSEAAEEIKVTSQNYIYTGILLAIVGILVNTYIIVQGTPLESHMMEWLNIVIRLLHITFGIAWIGASFYFVFLENALNRTEDVRDELAGNLWAVHGGGFYYLEKYKVAPKTIPKHLHWFKYEAYFTWLSGFCLLFVVYYFNASAFLIDKNVLDITATQGILIGVGSFIVGWLIYDVMCKSSLIKNQLTFSIIGFLILIAFAWFYCHVFSSRAAYIHFGAMIGSIMVANVFFVIIPAQKAMVRAAKLGLPLDPALGKNALTRSLHNNYFTLPVLFVMVSNHFPSTFGYEYPWLILAVISLGAAGVKHYLNLKEKKELNVWILPVSVVILLAACFISAPSANPNECKKEVSIVEVQEIIQKRCAQCHSSAPTDDVYKVAPNGVMYDTPEDIAKKKDLIMQRVVLTKTMPQNNKTNITEEERNTIRCWIEQGASLK